MIGVEERQLKDYKGYEVWKVVNHYGAMGDEVTYMLNNKNGDNLNCFSQLSVLKKWVDKILTK